MSTTSLPYPAVHENQSVGLLHKFAGFCLAFRICFTVLFFQSNPQMGTVVVTGCDLALVLVAVFYRMGSQFQLAPLLCIRSLQWILGFLALSCASLLWSETASVPVTAGYWLGMAADVCIPMLLVGTSTAEESMTALMQGFVYGSCGMALVAWCLPTLPDLRIGHDEYLLPNAIGMQCAIAALCAQYLGGQGRRWIVFSILLAITLLRSLSKTSIIAYMIAEAFYLSSDRNIQRKMKMYIVCAALCVTACFSTLLEKYFASYATSGDHQIESLTGRTWIWAVAFTMAVEKPLLGYGLYAFRYVIPAFGDFEPWHAHNEILQQFFELGIAGVILFIGIYWSLFRQARRSSNGRLRTFAIATLIFAVVHGFTDAVLFGLSYPLWLVTAVSIALASGISQSQEITA